MDDLGFSMPNGSENPSHKIIIFKEIINIKIKTFGKGIMSKNCEELLENIQKTLHECCNNKRTIDIKEEFDMRECKNVAKWSKTIKDCIKLKIEMKNPVVHSKYSIEYRVDTRSLIIS